MEFFTEAFEQYKTYMLSAGVVVNLACAVVLYFLGNQVSGRGTAWAISGSVFGPLAAIYCACTALLIGSNEHSKEITERAKIDSLLEKKRSENKSAAVETGPIYVDMYAENLLDEGSYAEVQRYLRDKLIAAHEVRNAQQEALYREYLDKVQELEANANLQMSGKTVSA